MSGGGIPVVYIDESDDEVFEHAIRAREAALEMREDQRKRAAAQHKREQAVVKTREQAAMKTREQAVMKSKPAATAKSRAANNAGSRDSPIVLESSQSGASQPDDQAQQPTAPTADAARRVGMQQPAMANAEPKARTATRVSKQREECPPHSKKKARALHAADAKKRASEQYGANAKQPTPDAKKRAIAQSAGDLKKPDPDVSEMPIACKSAVVPHHGNETESEAKSSYGEDETINQADDNASASPTQETPLLSLRAMLGMYGHKYVDPSGRVQWIQLPSDAPAATLPRRAAASRQPEPDTATSINSRVLEPCAWPPGVYGVRWHYNPEGIQFSRTTKFGFCACESSCRVTTCTNARVGIFCDRSCCIYAGKCGNGVEEHPKLRLVTRSDGEYAVQATGVIEEGVVLGEYLGELKYDTNDNALNNGYSLQLKTRSRARTTPVVIDAAKCGGLTRFMNHSCNATAAFYEVNNGTKATAVVASTRVIASGEEVTVNYGPSLWFLCTCNEPNCCHASIHEAAAHAAKMRQKIAAIGALVGFSIPSSVAATILEFAGLHTVAK